ncbi:MAG: hypothetical protein U1E92_03775 [Moraxella osloensis]
MATSLPRNGMEFPPSGIDNVSESDWQAILNVKETVNKAYEIARTDKVIIANLSANVTVFAPDSTVQSLNKLGDELKFVLISSQASVKPFAEKPSDVTYTDEATSIQITGCGSGQACHG